MSTNSAVHITGLELVLGGSAAYLSDDTSFASFGVDSFLVGREAAAQPQQTMPQSLSVSMSSLGSVSIAHGDLVEEIPRRGSMGRHANRRNSLTHTPGQASSRRGSMGRYRRNSLTHGSCHSNEAMPFYRASRPNRRNSMESYTRNSIAHMSTSSHRSVLSRRPSGDRDGCSNTNFRRKPDPALETDSSQRLYPQNLQRLSMKQSDHDGDIKQFHNSTTTLQSFETTPSFAGTDNNSVVGRAA